METVLGLALIAAFGGLVLGLIHPSLIRHSSRAAVARRFGLATLACLLLIVLFVDVPESEPRADLPASIVTPPDYTLIETQDISFAQAVRLNARVSVPEHYSEADVRLIAEDIVDRLTQEREVNAISVMLWGPDTPTDGSVGWDVAEVDWAPGGVWGDAMNVRTGDYRTHEYRVNYRNPEP